MQCWSGIAPAQQLVIGQKFQAAPSMAEAMTALTQLIEGHTNSPWWSWN